MTLENLKQEVTSLKGIYSLLDETRNARKVWKHRASSTTSFLANPLHYALAQGLGVNFGATDKTIVGTAVHSAVDYAYNNPSKGVISATKELIKTINEELKNLQIGLVVDVEAIKKEAFRLFKLYYNEVLIHNRNTFVASEEYLEVNVPVGMYKNPNNFGKIMLTGTFDRLYKDSQGNFILGDLKTSAKKISGSVEKSKELQDFEAEIGSLQESKKEYEKLISKFLNAETKCREIMEEKAQVQIAFNDAKLNGKATKALENKLEKLNSEFEKWCDNLERLEEAEKKIIIINEKLLKLQEESEPLFKAYEVEKNKAELEACKQQYGFQVALYSLMYMIVHGIEIKKTRLEIIVKTKVPQIQIFEWELDDDTLRKAEDAIQMVVSTIEAFYNGVDSSLLFRPNPYTFYGSETNEFINTLKGDIMKS